MPGLPATAMDAPSGGRQATAAMAVWSGVTSDQPVRSSPLKRSAAAGAWARAGTARRGRRAGRKRRERSVSWGGDRIPAIKSTFSRPAGPDGAGVRRRPLVALAAPWPTPCPALPPTSAGPPPPSPAAPGAPRPCRRSRRRRRARWRPGSPRRCAGQSGRPPFWAARGPGSRRGGRALERTCHADRPSWGRKQGSRAPRRRATGRKEGRRAAAPASEEAAGQAVPAADRRGGQGRAGPGHEAACTVCAARPRRLPLRKMVTSFGGLETPRRRPGKAGGEVAEGRAR